MGMLRAAMATASQNFHPRNSAANGTIHTTYWIESTLLVASSISTDTQASVTTVLAGTAAATARSAWIRRQPRSPSSPKPTAVAAGRRPSQEAANGPSTCTAPKPNDVWTGCPPSSPVSSVSPPPIDSIWSPRCDW
ncbi:MAG: hypothetical protein HYX55_10575 [Chloroflexi bacterium]|nr:hypothetical protein [Chloroflexota bacterium]